GRSDATQARDLEHLHGGDRWRGLYRGRRPALHMDTERHCGDAELPVASPCQHRQERRSALHRLRYVAGAQHRPVSGTRQDCGWEHRAARRMTLRGPGARRVPFAGTAPVLFARPTCRVVYPTLLSGTARPAPATRARVKPHLLLVSERGMQGLEGGNDDVHGRTQRCEPLLEERKALARASRNLRWADTLV